MKWKEVAPLPLGRTVHTAVLLHGSIYIGGGYEGKCIDNHQDQSSYRLDVYNMTTGKWDSSPITTPYCKFAMTALDNKLTVVGGQKSNEVTNKVLFLDGGEWKPYAEMPSARSSVAAIGYQSVLITVGGTVKVNGDWVRLSTTELLDTTNGCWYTCDDLPLPHCQLKAAIVEKELHLFGGTDKDFSSSLCVFTASLNNLSTHQLKWQSLPDTPWCHSTPVALYNKFLLAFGGRRPSDDTSQTTEVCAFNPSTEIWEQIVNIPEPRNFIGAVCTADNKVIVTGGTTRQGQISCKTWVGEFDW